MRARRIFAQISRVNRENIRGSVQVYPCQLRQIQGSRDNEQQVMIHCKVAPFDFRAIYDPKKAQRRITGDQVGQKLGFKKKMP